jgi:hypothetical protein
MKFSLKSVYKISTNNLGQSAADDAMKPIENLTRSIFPMLDIVKQQTGIDVPKLLRDYTASPNKANEASSSNADKHQPDNFLTANDDIASSDSKSSDSK